MPKICYLFDRVAKCMVTQTFKFFLEKTISLILACLRRDGIVHYDELFCFWFCRRLLEMTTQYHQRIWCRLFSVPLILIIAVSSCSACLKSRVKENGTKTHHFLIQKSSDLSCLIPVQIWYYLSMPLALRMSIVLLCDTQSNALRQSIKQTYTSTSIYIYLYDYVTTLSESSAISKLDVIYLTITFFMNSCLYYPYQT